MATPGYILKTERENQGKSLKDISGNLKLSTVYLSAIEDDDYSLLPAEIFTRAYLRLYADELRLDGDYILDLFHDLGKDDSEDITVLSEKEPEHVSSTLVKSAFHDVRTLSDKVKCSIKTVPASLKKLISSCNMNRDLLAKCKPSARMDFSFIQKAEPLKAARKYFLLAVTIVAAPLAVIMISNSDKLFPEKPHAADKQFVNVKTSAEDKKEVMSSENVIVIPETKQKQVVEKIEEKLVLKIIAEELTWASVRIDGGEYNESLLHEGESVTVRAEETLHLKIGNAGGTKLVLNGRELEELGPHGKVVNIQLP
jgi:transcriptional regulator with XRE-family HTH domain